MSFLSNALKNEDETDLVGYKNRRKLVKSSGYQIGKSIKSIDSARHSLPSGKRISANGKIYYENRKNRSDLKGSSV
jgi:hypothetical protein